MQHLAIKFNVFLGTINLKYIMKRLIMIYNSHSLLSAICKLPSKPGPCRASRRRWTYNYSKEKCETFTYGGCRGNANNFPTEKECRDFCKAKQEGPEKKANRAWYLSMLGL